MNRTIIGATAFSTGDSFVTLERSVFGWRLCGKHEAFNPIELI